MSIFWLEEKLFSTLPQGQATAIKLHHWVYHWKALGPMLFRFSPEVPLYESCKFQVQVFQLLKKSSCGYWVCYMSYGVRI